ncbi:glycosyltransferase [Alishewanella sp. d11]|uniref:glycosyltransferase n=1 Tax=Alishewanella sp. d11 TaxID=3414030 RepID=UPI003BF8A6E0
MNKYDKYDGVICFAGEDWWYHNHGHFDMKVMECLAKDKKVLFINSVGMRVPVIGKSSQVFKKIFRKLKSIFKGTVKVNSNFYVYSPFYLPGKTGQSISDIFLKAQVKWQLKKLGIKKPLVWVVTPTVSKTAFAITNDVIYQRTDKNEELSDGNFEYIDSHVKNLKKNSLFTIYSSKDLLALEERECARCIHVCHGISDVFFDGNLSKKNNEMSSDLSKKVLFVGAVDSHTFDLILLEKASLMNPSVSFYIVGDVTLDKDFKIPSNVYFLGKKEQSDIPSYLDKADVLTMFWLQNDWIKYCSPIKYKEYLSAGKPIVSTEFSGCGDFKSDFVYICNTHEEFLNKLSLALDLNNFYKVDMTEHRWVNKANKVVRFLNEI